MGMRSFRHPGSSPSATKWCTRHASSRSTLEYEITVTDQKTWTSPWTLAYPMKLDNDYQMFEYACHEGNYGLPNILSAARAAEKK